MWVNWPTCFLSTSATVYNPKNSFHILLLLLSTQTDLHQQWFPRIRKWKKVSLPEIFSGFLCFWNFQWLFVSVVVYEYRDISGRVYSSPISESKVFAWLFVCFWFPSDCCGSFTDTLFSNLLLYGFLGFTSEAMNVRRGGELISVDMLLIEGKVSTSCLL